MDAFETSTSERAICERDIKVSGETGGIAERATPPHEILRQLLRIDRYERGAFLRRRRAMRALLLLQTG